MSLAFLKLRSKLTVSLSRRAFSSALSLSSNPPASLNASALPSPPPLSSLSSSPLSAERSRRRAAVFTSKGKELKDFLKDSHAEEHHHEHGGKICTKVSRGSLSRGSRRVENWRCSSFKARLKSFDIVQGCLNCRSKAAKEQEEVKLG